MRSLDKDQDFMMIIPWKDSPTYMKDSGADASLRTLVNKVVGADYSFDKPFEEIYSMKSVDKDHDFMISLLSVFWMKNDMKAWFLFSHDIVGWQSWLLDNIWTISKAISTGIVGKMS